MSVEEGMKAEPRANTGNVLSACLVDGNPEQIAREKKIKRRALILSTTLQSAGLAVLLIAPLFAKPAELVSRIVTPTPPYHNPPAPRRERVVQITPRNDSICVPCALANQPPILGTVVERPITDYEPIGGGELPVADNPIPSATQNVFEIRSHTIVEPPPEKKRLVIGHLDPAMLTHRVEPVYPAPAKATRRSGKVELHALIATDGTVQSLQVVSGDPLLVRSALDAVREWRYKPTYLNGQAVEVDTYITVIYSLQQ